MRLGRSREVVDTPSVCSLLQTGASRCDVKGDSNVIPVSRPPACFVEHGVAVHKQQRHSSNAGGSRLGTVYRPGEVAVMEPSVAKNAGSVVQEYLSRMGLPPEFGHALVKNHNPIEYPKGAIVFRQESPADLLFWVQSGLLKICAPRPDGSRFVVRLAGPNEILGFVQVTASETQKVQGFTAEAFTKCSVAPITREHVLRLLSRLSPGHMVKVLEETNAAWAGAFTEFVGFLSLTFRERLQNVFDDLGKRFGVTESRGILLTPELSHEDLAEMIGSSRPMASRLIAEMIEEHVIERHGRRYILASRPNSH